MNRGVLAEDASAMEESTIEVESITLDAVAQEHGWPSVIKIDVEGSEAAVLRGSEEIFRSAKPLLVCEFITRKLPLTSRTGYWNGVISSNGSKVRWNFHAIYLQCTLANRKS